MEFIKSWADIIDLPSLPEVINPQFLKKPAVDKELAGFLNIDTEHVRVFDSSLQNNGSRLFLVHYTIQPPPKEIRDLRGVIIEKNKNDEFKILCRSFPFTEERLPSSSPIPDFYFRKPDTVVVQAYEGTVFRVWWYEKKWFLSTPRKIDARNSKWAGPVFGEMFKDIMTDEEIDTVLDRNVCYTFLMCHPDNRLITSYKEACLYHVGVYNPLTQSFHSSGDEEFKRSIVEHKNIKYPEEMKVESWNDLISQISDLDWKTTSSGALVRVGKIPIKVTNSSYEKMRELRGNEPNLRIRWFQLLEEKRSQELEDLLPEKKEFFDKLKVDNESVIEWLINIYNKRFVQKDKTQLPKEVFWVVRMCRDAMKNFNKSELEVIMKETVQCYNPRVRNALIREMYREEKMIARQSQDGPQISSLTITETTVQ